MENISKIFAYSKNSLSLSLLKEMPPIKFVLRWSKSEFITNPFYAVMSLIEYHIIKILIPCRNLQLWPMLSFNLSVINEPNWTSENFHGHACFPVFKSLFWFFFAFSLWTQCSYTNHTTGKNKKNNHQQKTKHRGEISSLASYLRVTQFCYIMTIVHNPQFIFRAAVSSL